MDLYDVIIVGGGASGLMAALHIPEHLKVLVLERQEQLARKIGATGNGRCNLGNLDLHPTNFHGENRWFAEAVISAFDTDQMVKRFLSLGLFIRSEQDRLYPYSMQARSVAHVLIQGVTARRNVEIMTGHRVSRILKSGGLRVGERRMGDPGMFEVHCEDRMVLRSRMVLLCCGGMAAPKLGTEGDGYRMAADLQQPVIPPVPALVQLVTARPDKRLAGIRIQGRISVQRPPGEEAFSAATSKGEILLTDYGLSGIPTLNVSHVVARILEQRREAVVELDLFPEMKEAELMDYLQRHFAARPDCPADDWGTGFLPLKLTQTLLNTAIGSARAERSRLRDLGKRAMSKLVGLTKCWPHTVVSTKGFDHAQVTAGGLDTALFDPDTLESMLVPGLFCAGELLDIHGDCGGYNLHWAWASAVVAARGIASKLQ